MKLIREALQEGRAHLTISGRFQSDKYEWSPAGFLPLKLSDEDAVSVLRKYGYVNEVMSDCMPGSFVLVAVADKRAHSMLREYAPMRGVVDREFQRDLVQAIRNVELAA